MARESPSSPAALVQNARRVLILTGAGISAESGVPTFRGPDGLWRAHRPEELATPGAFARDPRLVWEWYGWRRELISHCTPNAAHLALAHLALSRDGVRIVTQNVDELHADAARAVAGGGDASPAMPLELHGSIFRMRCTRCRERRSARAPIDATSTDTLPRCSCGALLRPDVVWFGESLDDGVIAEAFRLAAEADLCLVIGTSGVVQPAASLAGVTLANGGVVVEVNPDQTPLSASASFSIRGTAVGVVPTLLREAGQL